MIELSDTAYLGIKTLHIISVIAWMAGLLYLPRLFVYHVDAEPGSELSETLKIMERRLLKQIMNPAHDVLLRSKNERELQCRDGVAVTVMPGSSVACQSSSLTSVKPASRK